MFTLRKRTRSVQKRRRRGTALVEFALILPVLLILVAGVLDISRGYSQAGMLANAVRQGARYGASHPTDIDTIKSRVIEEGTDSGVVIDANKIEVTTPTGTAPGQSIKVKLTYEYQPLLGGIFGVGKRQIIRECSMPIL